MAGNRKLAEDIIINGLEEINPGVGMAKLYRETFDRMTDKDFDEFMIQLRDGAIRLAVFIPNFESSSISTANNIRLGRERYGFNFFQRIWINPGNGMPKYLTPHRYLLLELTDRRQAQVLIDKISIPKSTRVIDDLTGQPTGESKGSRISYNEAQIIMGQGLVEPMVEAFKYRGGDVEGFRLMNEMISQTGDVELKDLERIPTEVESKVTLSTILTAMHLSNTL